MDQCSSTLGFYSLSLSLYLPTSLSLYLSCPTLVSGSRLPSTVHSSFTFTAHLPLFHVPARPSAACYAVVAQHRHNICPLAIRLLACVPLQFLLLLLAFTLFSSTRNHHRSPLSSHPHLICAFIGASVLLLSLYLSPSILFSRFRSLFPTLHRHFITSSPPPFSAVVVSSTSAVSNSTSAPAPPRLQNR